MRYLEAEKGMAQRLAAREAYTQSMSLKYEPASEPLHISVKYLLSNKTGAVSGGGKGHGTTAGRAPGPRTGRPPQPNRPGYEL